MDREILREIGAISRLIAAMREREFSRYGLKRGQHAFLTRIVENPGISQKELSKLLLVDKGTTAKAVKKIEEAGYIYRERSPKDHKVYEIYVTDKGRKLYSEVVEEIKRTGRVALEGIEEDRIYRELQRMRGNLEEEWEKNKNSY